MKDSVDVAYKYDSPQFWMFTSGVDNIVHRYFKLAIV